MKKIKVLGIDLAKNVFQLHGIADDNSVVIRRKVKRVQFLDQVRQSGAEWIYMEACGSAHHWARCLEREGFNVKLLPPHRVKAFVRGSKNDGNDAEAVAIAGQQPSVREVAVKTLEQQDIQSLHRVRELTKHARTATVNQARGLLAEYGIVMAKRASAFRTGMPLILEDAENGLTDRIRGLISDLWEEYQRLDERVAQYDRDLKALTEQIEPCQRLLKLEGVGPQTATAFYAAVGDAKKFKNGREVSAWLGLVPGQHSSGERQQLLGITKRGDRYLRTLLIHGARSMVRYASKMPGRRGEWLRGVIERRGPNKAAVALANKNARILWALMASGSAYECEAA